MCLVSMVLSTMWWPGNFRTVSMGQALVFSIDTAPKKKDGGLIPTGALST